MPTPLEYFNRVSVIIITGGSSGIGCSIIKAIKKIAPDITVCNLSRTKPTENFGEKMYHFETDLTSGAALALSADAVLKLIEGLPSGDVLLVNNSGFGDYGVFSEAERAKQLSMIDLNIKAMVDLTARMMPVLLERGGRVVNIASTAAFQPTPFLATYGATKSFVLNWSLALNEDLSGTGVSVLAVCPGPTRSNFFKAAGFETPPMDIGAGKGLDMTSGEVADKTLSAIAAGETLVVTGWKNKLISIFGGKLPIRFVSRVGGALLRKMRLETHKASQ